MKHTTVAQGFTEPGQQMLFLFDYGDEWRFVVELLRIGPPAKGVHYPRLIKAEGIAPAQYPYPEQTVQ